MKCPNWVKSVFNWGVGVNPQGLGTLLLGIAALIALSQTASILDRVLEIQEQAKKIDRAVSIMGEQLKRLEAMQTVVSAPALNEQNPTREQVIDALKNIPANPSGTHPLIYLPAEKRDETIEKILKSKNVQERTTIIKNSLKIDDIKKNVDDIKSWDKGE